MGSCRGILQCSSIPSISKCKKKKIGCLLCKIGIKRKRYSAADEMLTSNCLLVIIYLWINISHLFVCLPSLELTKFERVCSTKIGYANALSLRTNSNKKWNMVAFNSAHQAKKAIYIHSGWFERQQRGVRIASSKFSKTKICLSFEYSWRKVYSRTTAKLIPLLQPEHGFFFRQNGPERFHVQDWYPNEKMVMVHVCLNGWCCFSECLGVASY